MEAKGVFFDQWTFSVNGLPLKCRVKRGAIIYKGTIHNESEYGCFAVVKRYVSIGSYKSAESVVVRNCRNVNEVMKQCDKVALAMVANEEEFLKAARAKADEMNKLVMR